MLAALGGALKGCLRTGVIVSLTAVAVATAGAAPALAAKYAAIVVDTKTGRTLHQENADAIRYPASLTKMMTLYMLFGALERGEVTLSTRLTVSKFAASQAPSKLGARPGSTISVADAILALVTKSANDVAVVIAENLAGSEAAFASRMTAAARALGMARTTFRNASGLPNPQQVTTARDMALLGRALQDSYPKYFRYFSARKFTWNGKVIAGHNRLLGRVRGVDGIKTGYTRASGYNLVTSVNDGNRRLVAVVLGGSSGRSRDAKMTSLINEYLPMTATGPRTAPMVVARGAAAAPLPVMAAADLPSPPIPRPRPDPNAPPVAVAVLPTTIAAPEAAADLGAAEAAAPAPDFAAASLTARIAAEVDGEGEGDTDDGEAGASAPQAATEWKIQVGALPTPAAAIASLDRARKAAPSLLRAATSYTEQVTSGGTTLYRARFAGFTSKEQARAACGQLAKHDVACLAIR